MLPDRPQSLAIPNRIRYPGARPSHDPGIIVLAGFCLVLFALASATGVMAEEARLRPTALVLGTELRTSDPEELRFLILRALTNRYAEVKGIHVSQADIDAYVEGMSRIAKQDRVKRDARIQDIEGRLKSPRLDESERKVLTSELRDLNQLQQDLDAGSAEAEKTPEGRKAQRQIAAAFVLQWKINQALYQQYGGRIIFQQGGPEPLDAYRKFLEERQRAGDFRILNKSLETAFWRYYRDDSIHSFYPSGSEAEARVLRKPWWQ